MPKSRPNESRPLLSKSPSDSKAKLASRPAAVKSASGKHKKEPPKSEIVRLHQNAADQPLSPDRQIAWWIDPEPRGQQLIAEQQASQRPPIGPGGPGGFHPGGPGGPGGFHPGGPGGPGGFHPGVPGGPGGFHPGGPGGPGGFHPGGPGGPGGFHPGGPGGPGGFHPGGPGGPDGFHPGFPGHGPFFPGPVPFPLPIPVPIPGPYPIYPPYPPYPGPGPYPPYPVEPGPYPPGGPGVITIALTGGTTYPGVNYRNLIQYYPGITIKQALESTGLVVFGPSGFIRGVAGIPITGNTGVSVRYNGRIIPQTILGTPAEPGSTITLELNTLLG